MSKAYKSCIFSFSDRINFQASKNLFDQMHENIASDPYIQNGTINSWYLAFKHWIGTSGHPAIAPTLNAGTCQTRFSLSNGIQYQK